MLAVLATMLTDQNKLSYSGNMNNSLTLHSLAEIIGKNGKIEHLQLNVLTNTRKLQQQNHNET